VTDLAARRTVVVAALGGDDPDPTFHLDGWDVGGDTVALRYTIDGLGSLTETVRFPGHDLARAASEPATAGALTLLHLAAATSYAKAVVPSRVSLDAVPRPAVAMLAALLTDGLAEFAVTNGLHPLPAPELRYRTTPAAPTTGLPDGVLVPVGGGKDSAVTAVLAVRAGWDAALFAVDPKPSMERTAAALGMPLLTAHRRLDPTVLRWNAAGAWNGHVPVTAIVASIACVAATLEGRGEVLLSNEASADAPTRVLDGHEVNHQYSKSSRFEALHVAAATALTGGATRATSLLRPLPELVIAAAFAASGVPLSAINSCNRAYARTGTATEWCGACPKCRFVQLQLAPFTTPAAWRAATGFDALADRGQLPGFGDLLAPDRKPFECVGTVAEVQLAFDLAAADPAWASHAAVVAYGDASGDPWARFRTMCTAITTDALPARSRAALDDLLEGLAP
jgi:UDP-N-acetyl-alpha-D-muramoyl-L-alanyl-L-glutamate epimerase